MILLIVSISVLGQMPEDWGAFCQKVNVSSYQGCRFKITAAVRISSLEAAAGAELWARIEKFDNTRGFFYNMMDKPIKSPEWRIYTIEGKIDRNSHYLLMGGLYQRRGYFYFDDFHLQVETGRSGWKEVTLPDQGFEQDSLPPDSSWRVLQSRPFFTFSLSRQQPFEGNSAICVDGSTFTKSFTYGSNDTAGRYATVNGIRLYYEIYGEGAPILLLHGNSESIASFSKQIPELSRNHKVIAVDTRGQGRSSEDGKQYTYDLFAEDMNALLDYLHLDSVNVVGWSDGGNTGLIMAIDYPTRVRKLAVMGANVFIDKTVVDPWVFKNLHKQQELLAKDTAYASQNRSRLITLLLTEPRHRFEDLKAISCPVLVMAGEKDIIKETHTRQIAQNIGNSQLVIFPGGTHDEPTDNPGLFNKTVLEFVDR